MNSIIATLFLLFSIHSVFGQDKKAENTLFEKSLKKDSILAEFDQLYQLTNTIHPGQFMCCSKTEFDQTFLRLRNTITSDLSIVDYYKLTATLMATIRDGHTAVDRTRITSLLKDRLVFPFSIFEIKGHYYFDKSTEENKKYAGLELLKINRKDIHSIVNEIQQWFHLECRNETGLNTRLKNFPFYYFTFNQTDEFVIEYLDEKKEVKTRRGISGISYEDFTKNTTETVAPITTKFPRKDIAILKYHSFENGYSETDRKVAEKQLDQFFSQLDSLKVTKLILDLRGNSGGSADIANYLFSYLARTPYYYFDYIGAKYSSVKEWKRYAQYPDNIGEINVKETKLKNGLYCYTETDSLDYWWFEKQQNKLNHFKGKLSVLMDGGCFSTTGHLLSLLKEHTSGIFYGEYSQGSNYSNSGGQAFVLPYSKTLVWIPTFQFKMRTPNFVSDPKGIRPNVEIQMEPNDLKTNFDRPMGFVIKQLEQDK